MTSIGRCTRIPRHSLLWALFFLVSPGFAFPTIARADWLLDASALALRDDNVSGAADGYAKADTIFSVSAAGGYYDQIAPYTGLAALVELESENYSEYGGLNTVSGGLAIHLNHKFGVGLRAPRLTASVSYRLKDFKDNHRDVTVFLAGFTGSSWLTERLKVAAGYQYDNSVSVNADAGHCKFSGYAAYLCDLGKYQSPYGGAGHSLSVQFAFLLTDADMLTAGYRHRRGDVAVSSAPDAALLAQSSALWPDWVFHDFTAYRIDAATNSVNVGVSRELARQVSLNLDYLHHAAEAGNARYGNNVFRIGIAYSF